MREISQERLQCDAKRVLKYPFFASGLHTGITYSRVHDDDDGTGKGVISVYFEPHSGDAFVEVDAPRGSLLRFRTQIGGTLSPRVYNAIMLLALAIKEDNEERPACNPETFRLKTD